MKLFFFGFFLLAIVSFAYAGGEQKLEGKCSGQLENGSQVGFSYFSDYEGCQGNISSSIKFSSASGLGNHKGNRTFENNKDIYLFKSGRRNTQKIYQLTFEDSTGNISGVLDYSDLKGNRHSITVQCVIRDYEYEECPE
jgi:hypothetical protein